MLAVLCRETISIFFFIIIVNGEKEHIINKSRNNNNDSIDVISEGIEMNSLDDFNIYLDDNGKLTTHLLLYPKFCSSFIYNQFLMPRNYHNDDDGRADDEDGQNYAFDFHRQYFFGRKTHPISNNIMKNLEGCDAVCVERGLDHSLIQYPMPHLFFRNDSNSTSTSKSVSKSRKEFWKWYIDNCAHVQFGFINYYSQEQPVNVYFLPDDDYSMKQLKASIYYGEGQTQFLSTYLGHTFVVEDPSNDNKILLQHKVEFAGVKTVGRLEVTDEEKERYPKENNLDDLIRSALKNEYDRSLQVKYKFTPHLGFKKGELPKDLFGTMNAYYYNNRNHKYIEEYELNDVYINWWETNVYIIQPPWDIRSIWQNRLLQLVESWVNDHHNIVASSSTTTEKIKLEQTDMYGMRVYTNGARLLTHVDREETHAVSLIINIEQVNVQSDWDIEIYDHHNRLHTVALAPGEILYYESAKCLHGRNAPLNGRYYVNLFTHYRPINDPKWYLKDDHHKFNDGNYINEPLHHHNDDMNIAMLKVKNAMDLYDYHKLVERKGSSLPSLQPKCLQQQRRENPDFNTNSCNI